MYMKNTQDYIATGIRLPPKMHKQIRDSAYQQRRTFNSMAVTILDRGMQKTELEELMAEIGEIKTFCLEIKQFIELVRPKEVKNTSLIVSSKSSTILPMPYQGGVK